MKLFLFALLLWGCAPTPTWPMNVPADVSADVVGEVPPDASSDASADTSADTASDTLAMTDVVVAPDVPEHDHPVVPRDVVPGDLPSVPDVPRFPDVVRRSDVFPPLRVYVSPDWTADQGRNIRLGLAILAPVAPMIEETSDAMHADLVFQPVRATDCAVEAGGVFTRTAYADPRCFPTSAGFTFPQAVAHLALHVLGARHVCVGPGESRTDCSPVPYGRGILNAHFAEESSPARTLLGWTEGLSPEDVAEARRALAAGGW